MIDSQDVSSNQSENIVPIRRRPGPPKGTPRPPGAGRKPGTPNRVTRDVREAAQQYSAKALKALVKMLDDPDSRVRATAAREILDRAHGKPAQALEHSGPDGAPLSEPQDDREIAKALAFVLSKAVRAQEDEDAKAGTLVLTPDDLAPLNPKPLPEAPAAGLEPEPPPARQWPTPDEAGLLRAQRQEDRAFERGNAPRVIMGRHR